MESAALPTSIVPDEKSTSVGDSKKPTDFLTDIKAQQQRIGTTKTVMFFFLLIACVYGLFFFFSSTGIILVVLASLLILKKVKTVTERGFQTFFINKYYAHKNDVDANEEVGPLVKKIFYSGLAYYAICVMWRVCFVAERVWYWGGHGWPHNYELVSMFIILSMLICCYKALKDSKKKHWLFLYGIAHA